MLIASDLDQKVISVMMMMMMLMMSMMKMIMMTTMSMMRVARVLIAFNLNQKVIRVNLIATTGDQDW